MGEVTLVGSVVSLILCGLYVFWMFVFGKPSRRAGLRLFQLACSCRQKSEGSLGFRVYRQETALIGMAGASRIVVM